MMRLPVFVCCDIILIAAVDKRKEAPMPQMLVRDLDPHTIERLKVRAKQHGRSLQGEVKVILEEAAILSMVEARAIAEQWQKRLKGRKFSDSARLIREDRKR